MLEGLGITTPSAHLISYIITGDSKQLGWGCFSCIGVFFLVPFLLQRVLESFVGACQTCQPSVRARLGGIFMGIGASWAGGCTIGNGLTATVNFFQ